MHSSSSLHRLFPLSQGATERPVLRAPRLSVRPELAPLSSLAKTALMRAWAARRAACRRVPPLL